MRLLTEIRWMLRRRRRLADSSLSETPPPPPPPCHPAPHQWENPGGSPSVLVRPNGFRNRQRSLLFHGMFAWALSLEIWTLPVIPIRNKDMASFDLKLFWRKRGFRNRPLMIRLESNAYAMEWRREHYSLFREERSKLLSPTISTIVFIEILCAAYESPWKRQKPLLPCTKLIILRHYLQAAGYICNTIRIINTSGTKLEAIYKYLQQRRILRSTQAWKGELMWKFIKLHDGSEWSQRLRILGVVQTLHSWFPF